MPVLPSAEKASTDPKLEALLQRGREWHERYVPSPCLGLWPLNEGILTCDHLYTPEGEFEFDWYITEAKGHKMPK